MREEGRTWLGAFEVLPLELISHIVEQRADDVSFVWTMCSLNSEWRRLLDTSQTWKRVFAAHFPSEYASLHWVCHCLSSGILTKGCFSDRTVKAKVVGHDLWKTTSTERTSQKFPWKERLIATLRCPLARVYLPEEEARRFLQVYRYHTFRVDVGVSCQATGRWYFEVELLHTTGHPNMQLGWLTNPFDVDSRVEQRARAQAEKYRRQRTREQRTERGEKTIIQVLTKEKLHYGVGDDSHSWGFDGFRLMRYHNGKQLRDYGGRQWQNGDRIGCCLDLDAATISYYLNGRYLGVAFSAVTEDQPNGSFFYPGVTYYGSYFPTFLSNQSPQHCQQRAKQDDYPSLVSSDEETHSVSIGVRFVFDADQFCHSMLLDQGVMPLTLLYGFASQPAILLCT
ncbi:E3 ubiquitin-protein ligase RKP [Balamuthia mandrillaris]